MLLCCFLLFADNCSSFEFPSLQSFADVFDRLGKLMSSSKKSDTKANSSKSQRMKRQSTDIGDESTNPWEVRSSSIPMMPDKRTINTRYMPTLGNGYIGTTVYSDSIFLNGLYSGEGAESHRAEIPAILMTRVNLTTPDFERRATRKFTINAQDGYWMESIKCEFADIEHKIYLHQKFIRLFVVDIYVKMNPATLGGGTITMNYPKWESSGDLTFGSPLNYRGNWQVKGETKSFEKGGSKQVVNIFYMTPLTQISISGSNREANYTMIMAIDKQEANARSEFDAAQQIIQAAPPAKGNYDLFMQHVTEWRKTWATGRVEIQGADAQLTKAVRFAQFYILNSLPAENPALPPVFSEVFYGCGRTSIGKGSLNKDYQGHVMYDNEFYIMPAILPFHPNMAKGQLRYRSAMLNAAASNAALFGGTGAHFPYESAFSGAEVSPDTCSKADPKCNWRRIFVTAGVQWGIRQYYSMTRDRDFMINPVYKGCDVSANIAKFLAGQAIYNPRNARYDMIGITGPDDSHPNKDNNAFTLCAASLAIHWARYFSCLCQRNEREEVPDEYIQKALYLNLPYDNVKRLHFQYTGFDPEKDRPIKQADTIMLNYPLNWNYSADIMRNDLEFYETLTDTRTPAMTWSWFTIGWKWTKEQSKMRSYFLKSYQDYLIQPFKIWTEYNERTPSDQEVGNVNYLPGMGAFLQSIIFGFGGFRIRPDRLEVFNPMPPPGATKLMLYGFQYLQANLTFTIEVDKTTIQAISVTSKYPLILRRNVSMAVEESITTGATIVVDSASNGFFIYTSVAETCEHPRDYIYMPWGYSPWINRATTVTSESRLSFLLLSSVILTFVSRRLDSCY